MEGTAKILCRTLQASGRGPELKRGPDHSERARGRFIVFLKIKDAKLTSSWLKKTIPSRKSDKAMKSRISPDPQP